MSEKVRGAMRFFILFSLTAVITVNLAPAITTIGQASAVQSDQWCYSISSEAETPGSSAASMLPRNLHAQCFSTEFECQQALESDSNAATGQENCERQSLTNPDDDTGGGTKSDQWCYSISSEAETPGANAATLLPRNLHAQCFPTEFECQQALESDSNAATGQENCEHLSLSNPDDDGDGVDQGLDDGQEQSGAGDTDQGTMTAGG